MEDRILLIENKIEKLRINFENYIKSEVEKTKALTTFIEGYLEFLKKEEIEHDTVLKKFEELDSIVELMIKLRKGDEAIQNLRDSIDKLK